jgi:hypothetical protein
MVVMMVSRSHNLGCYDSYCLSVNCVPHRNLEFVRSLLRVQIKDAKMRRRIRSTAKAVKMKNERPAAIVFAI